jgi:hypothetical protein
MDHTTKKLFWLLLEFENVKSGERDPQRRIGVLDQLKWDLEGWQFALRRSDSSGRIADPLRVLEGCLLQLSTVK